MRRLARRFAEEARRCGDLDRLATMLAEAAANLGFDYFALLDHQSLIRKSPMLVRIDNYPEPWVRELVARGYAADDPVHMACRRCNTGFSWLELETLVDLDRRQRQILAQSRSFGLGAGFTVPSNLPGEPSASCSFAVRDGRLLPLHQLYRAELIGAHALRAARRLRRIPSKTPPRLSMRERECLRLVAIGKTDWEIARILGLSINTVHQYVKGPAGPTGR